MTHIMNLKSNFVFHMFNLRSFSISYLLPCVAVFAIACSSKEANSSNKLCKHTYALCTSALCVPEPGDPQKAICFCDVKEGPSLSTVDCEKIKPSTDDHGIKTVYSTFSFDQFHEGKKGMVCPSGTPWTWCLNKRCTVDPANPQKAICVCDVKREGEWTTLGGNCNTSTCKTGYWSGATLDDLESGSAFLTRMLGLKASPVTWCEAK